MKKRSFFICLGLGILIYLLNPLALDRSQNIIFSTMLAGVAMWATSAIDKTIVSIAMLLVFSFVGKSNPVEVFSFIWSDTALLIMTSSVLSAAFSKTGLAQALAGRYLDKTGKNLRSLMVLAYLMALLLIFFIPQAFARSLVIAGVFSAIISDDKEYKQLRYVLFFNVFWAVSLTYMIFSNGDVVLNQSAIAFGGEEAISQLTFINWAQAMALPTIILCFLSYFLTRFIFRKELSYFDPAMIRDFEGDFKLTKDKKIILIIVGIVVVFWMTVSIHGISEWIPALVAILILIILRLISKEELKSIDPSFIIFLTAAFSIGNVLSVNGISDKILGIVQGLIPQGTFGIMFLMALALIVMILHMLIGSSVATLSVSLPILIPLASAHGYSPAMIVLLSYIVVNIHFILAHHHANLTIGVARGLYPDKFMMRYGLYMTPLTFLVLAFLYIPWWRFIGI